MTKNMTRDQYEASQAMRALHFPSPPTKEDIESAFRVVSFNISGGGDILAIRTVDGRGSSCDLVMDQAVAAELLGNLAKALHVFDWIDSAGAATLDPS